MREVYLKLEFFDEFLVTDCKGKQKVNEHMRYHFSGTIPIDRIEEYAAQGIKDCWVHVFVVGEDSENVWLCGVIEDMQLNVEGKTCRMQLTLASGTVLMDQLKHTRTFQNGTLKYQQILDTCNSAYETAVKIMTVANDKQIDQLVVQYKETDWEFVERMASQNHTVLVADVETRGVKYYFGLPKRENIITGDMQEHCIQYDIKAYWEKKNQGLTVSKNDFAYYIWKSREIYHIGDKGIIEGQVMIIWQIETFMQGNELYHVYYMKPQNAFQTVARENAGIAGASLFGTVIGVADEKVKVKLLEDENVEKAGSRWFSYATVYSSSDGTGWYCMPEIDDRIRLYFPTEKESDAYVASAYHEAGSNLRQDPSCKFWRNKQGKEVKLAKDQILVTNNKGTYMQLSDENGIDIVSNGSIRIQAGGIMEISSSQSLIELSARTKVSLRQGKTEMRLDKSGFDVKGSRVKL